jgi:hypothetical protein
VSNREIFKFFYNQYFNQNLDLNPGGVIDEVKKMTEGRVYEIRKDRFMQKGNFVD